MLFAISAPILAENFSPQSNFAVCFTPGDNCSLVIANSIDQAKKEIFVAAYSFTDMHIAKALIKAKQRGVDVKVLIDRSQIDNNIFAVSFLQKNNVYVKVDYQPAIAHNKTMIIDGTTVITGSYNYTYSANEKNAENVLIIQDKNLTKLYIENWRRRNDASVSIEKYKLISISKPSINKIF